MNIVQITPGAGGMYCGNCFRDNALVAELRRLGHDTLMVPLYLPMTLDEEDSSAGTPIFFSGINVYLEQKSAFFRRAPAWLHRLLASPRLLKWAAGRAARTRAEEVGDLTLSMFRGEDGHQARELDELIGWLKQRPPPDIVCLSNALLAGLARRLKTELRVPVVCMLQGEDSFLDGLTPAHREPAWRLMSERAGDVDLFIAPSNYFGGLMQRRMGLPAEKVRVVFNGINLAGYTPAPPHDPPVLGYFARMCREKGLDTLVEAFITLRKQERIKGLRLRVGGGCGPSDQPFVESLRTRLGSVGLAGEVEFLPNLDRAAKVEFYRSLSAFSVPARYGEAFGLYVLEALAAGVPVVQPRTAAFPELLEATGGGKLCEPDNPASLAGAIERLLGKPEEARALGGAGREAVMRDFTVERMARKLLQVFEEAATARFSARQS
jgi:glycosyltransferase involved in cell wall biosynthesis